MTGPEHYKKAEELLGDKDSNIGILEEDGDLFARRMLQVTEALTHATLAVAAGAAYGTAGNERENWYDAVGDGTLE